MSVDAVDYTPTATCRTCGYPLRHLPEARCPECGRTFDPADPRTMHVPGWRPPKPVKPPRPITFGGEIIRAAWLATSLCLFAWFGEAGILLTFYGCLIWVSVIGAAVFRTWGPPPSRDIALPEGPRWRWPVALLLLVSVLGSLSYDACPHGRYFGVGHVRLAHWTPNGPCRNQRHMRWLIPALVRGEVWE